MKKLKLKIATIENLTQGTLNSTMKELDIAKCLSIKNPGATFYRIISKIAIYLNFPIYSNSCK